MTRINNLNTPNIPKLEARIRALEAAAPMNNGAVGRSGFEVYDGGNINISNGSITINGALTGGGTFGWTGAFSQSGTSTFTGTTNLNGPTNVAGAFTVTGVTKLNGNTTVGGDTTVTGKLDVTGPMSTKGTLSVEGVTTLKNDLNVTTGKVKVGTMTLDPTISGGAMTFGNGAQVFTDATSVQMFKGSTAVQVDGSKAEMTTGGSTIRVGPTGVTLIGAARAKSTLAVEVMNTGPSGATANVYWDSIDQTLKVIP